MPAQFLIPDHSDLKAAFARALLKQMHLIDVEAAIREASAGEGDWIRPVGPRFEVLDLSGPVLRGANVLAAENGEVPAAELDEWIIQLRAVGVPEVYAPGAAVAARQVNFFPRIYSRDEGSTAQSKTTSTRGVPSARPADSREVSPRELNRAHRAHLDRLARWMSRHVDHDNRYQNISAFQALANEAAGIPTGGRDMASPDQLANAEVWMTARVIEHCRTRDEDLPKWISDAEGEN
jgi:hypothetical protein